MRHALEPLVHVLPGAWLRLLICIFFADTLPTIHDSDITPKHSLRIRQSAFRARELRAVTQAALLAPNLVLWPLPGRRLDASGAGTDPLSRMHRVACIDRETLKIGKSMNEMGEACPRMTG